jgi:hypothetical protein
MPPLVSHRIDDIGTQKLSEWIDALANWPRRSRASFLDEF